MFALTKFRTWGVDIAGPSGKRGLQHATLTITAALTDVALDIGTDGGTFWTQAFANNVYGQLARKAFDILNRIETNAEALWDVRTAQLLDRVQVGAAPAAGQYVLAIVGQIPNITVAAGDGELVWIVDLEWSMNDGIFPVVSSFG